jgi:hypothetical protein
MGDKIKKITIFVTKVGGVMVLVSKSTSALGFTSVGILGGSKAALIQAAIGNVAPGSAFAVAQSLGASGVVSTIGTVGGVLIVSGATVYGGYKLIEYINKPKPRL